MTAPDDEASEPGADDALGFEEEKTSPEVRVRHVRDDGKPIIIVGSTNGRRRRRIVELLWKDGWNAVEAHDPEELTEMVLTLAPQVVMIDGESFGRGRDMSLPEVIRHHRPDAALRTVALLDPGTAHSNRDANQTVPVASNALGGILAERIAGALSDGYDDFVADADNDVEVQSRATANLRAARGLAQLNRQRRDAALLLELTQTLASSLDMQLILHTVSRLIAEVIALERCSIVLLDPNDDDAIMVAASEDRTVRDLRIRLTNYPELKRCVETAAPVLIEDVTTDALLSKVSQSLVERGVRTMALFPIVYEEAVTGVLFLRSSKVKRALTDHEVQFGQTVAAACAVAIRNARIFDTFRDQNLHIESMRAQAERQNEALKKYQDFFEYAADGIAVIDVDGRIHYANKEGRRLLGRTRDELKDLRFQEVLVDESARLWPEVVAQVRHGRFKRSFDVYVAVAAEERVFSLSAGGVGQGTGLLILSFRDVTEMREMEGELRTTKEFLENLIDNSVDAIVAADMNGNIMLFNKGAELVYGYAAKDVIGSMHVSQLYPNTGANEVMRRLRDERWGGRGRLAPERREILTSDGVAVPVSMSASIIYEDGEEVATVGVFADLRDRMAIERQLNEAREQLTKAEKGRVAAELAGMAAHELNQPLTSVLGYAEMLRARIPESDVRLRRPIETIFKQAERMAEIVRKIGRITKYETKRYGGNTDMIDLNRAIADANIEPPSPIDDHKEGKITADNIPVVSTPSSFQGTSALSARPKPPAPPTLPNASLPPVSHEEDAVTAPPRPAGLLAALTGRKLQAASSREQRAAVVRPDTVDVEPPGYARRLRGETPPAAQPPAAPVAASHDAASVMTQQTMPSQPSRPLPRSVLLESQAPPADENDEHTNPGVKMSELRRRAKDDANK
ncbi:MAG: PAS domain S-box protein [Deltaproteobacteria bacterium]|nr:PAS domain S-box protein [Deltaproteobacteria bacterium]